MRYFILIILLFVSWPVSAQNAGTIQAKVQSRAFINNIKMEGFVLGDKNQFTKLFKPYRNRYLTASDMDAILRQVQDIYDQAGYQSLVSIDYQVARKQLIYRVSMIK